MTRDLSNFQFRGLGHAMLGTVIMVMVATLIGTPVGVLGAIYQVEFRKSRLAHVTRFVAELLLGVPSVLVGLFVYKLLIQPASSPASSLSLWSVPVVAQILWFFERISSLFLHPTGWAGSVALGVMLMTVVLKTSEEALGTVTNALRRASYALGATSAKTVMKEIVPAAAPAMIIGIFLVNGPRGCRDRAAAFHRRRIGPLRSHRRRIHRSGDQKRECSTPVRNLQGFITKDTSIFNQTIRGSFTLLG